MRTGATFRIHGAETAAITTALGLNSTGQPDDVWMIEVELADETELDVPIRQLLDVLERVADGLRQLWSDGARFDIFCYLGSNSLEHCAILDPTVLRRIADLPAELWLDVYPDDDYLND